MGEKVARFLSKEQAPELHAAVDYITRAGALSIEIVGLPKIEPTEWIAMAHFEEEPTPIRILDGDPVNAVLILAERVKDRVEGV